MAGAGRQAKISLTADLAQLRQRTEEAKRLLQSIGSVKLDRHLVSQFKPILTEIGRIKREIQDINSSVGGGGGGGSSGGAPSGGGGGSGGGFAAVARQKRALTTAIAALGVRSAFSRQFEIAREQLAIGAITGGGQVGGRSGLGFLQAERRQRAMGIAQASGRNISTKEMTGLVNRGEAFERAYGISGEMQAGAMGAARKAGVQDQGKFVSGAIGAAVAAKLEGSKIGEFLQMIANSTTQLSEGMNIDTASLRGFAGALGSLPFFKDDPARIQKEMASMDNTFKSGDRFQQAQAAQSIVQAAGGKVSAYGVELRRGMGLFGDVNKTLDPETAGRLRQMPGGQELMRTLGVGGSDIIRNQANLSLKRTSGSKDLGYRIQDLMTTSGMNFSQAAMTLSRGGPLSDKEMQKYKEAAATPEEQMKQTMDKGFSDVVKTMSAFDAMKDVMSNQIAAPLASIAVNVERIAAKLGIDVAKVGGTIGTAALGVGAAYAIGGSKLVGAAGAIGGAASGAASAAAPFALPALGLGAAGAAGYGVGTEINYALPSAKTRYGGPEANWAEKAMGKMFMSSDEYGSAYGKDGKDPLLESSTVTSENTSAIKELTNTLRGKAGGGIRDRQTNLPDSTRKVGM